MTTLDHAGHTSPGEEPSLVDELMAMDPANRWDAPVWVTGSVAHCYRDCHDMRQTAKPYHGIDPNDRGSRVTACRYCLERAASEGVTR